MALSDFQAARQRAALEGVIARVSGRSNDLLSYDDVARRLKLRAQVERGIKTIPVDAIVGSVGRCTEFTRTFLPRNLNDQERWARVKSVFMDPEGASLPPIEVYQVGDVYFVLDGNHRVSIARQEGVEFIDAHVIEMKTPVPLSPDVEFDDLIIKEEYTNFLEVTGLTQIAPGVDFSVTVPGQYDKILLQIEIQEYLFSEANPQGRSFVDAVRAWFEEYYLPLAEAIRERDLMRWFPGRTVTDMIIWISEHRNALEREIGWSLSSEAIVSDLAYRESASAEKYQMKPGSWRETRTLDRYTDNLFNEILVPLSGMEDSWQALQQAIVIGRHEDAKLIGLHVIGSKRLKNDEIKSNTKNLFEKYCLEGQVNGNLIAESGDIPSRILERAVLSDLIVIKLNHPPRSGAGILTSQIRAIISKSTRPIMVVPGESSDLKRIMLCFDGSPKSKEALFVSAYMAEKWKSSLTVFSALEGSRFPINIQEYAKTYLELHEIQAKFVLIKGRFAEVRDVIHEEKIDMGLVGGYGGHALIELVMGSTLDFMLREFAIPLLICK